MLFISVGKSEPFPATFMVLPIVPLQLVLTLTKLGLGSIGFCSGFRESRKSAAVGGLILRSRGMFSDVREGRSPQLRSSRYSDRWLSQWSGGWNDGGRD